MGYTIDKQLTRVNKGDKGDNNPEWIIFHFVGASGQAPGNASYFQYTYRGASAHYFVDPNIIKQVVEDDTPAWHIGDGSRTRRGKHNGYVNRGGATNTNSIGIECCQDPSTGDNAWEWNFDPETVKKAEWLIRKLQKEHNIDDDHVIRHFDASTKPCPGNWRPNNWKKWWEFKSRLARDVVQSAPKGNNNPEGKHDDEHMHLIEHGETLYSIAKQHDVSVDQLVQWNDLEDPSLIFPESKLFVEDPSVDYEPQDDIEQMAKDVIDGKYGSGAERRRRLGDNYDEVQDMVNAILLGSKSPSRPSKTITQLAHEVIDGQHGSGDERRRNLGDAYDAVQSKVNEILGSGSFASNRKTLDQLAKEVIDGQHGSGDARRRALGSRYDAVQNRVNEILGSGSGSERKSVNELVEEVMRGEHGSGRERQISLGNRYAEVQREINRRYR